MITCKEAVYISQGCPRTPRDPQGSSETARDPQGPPGLSQRNPGMPRNASDMARNASEVPWTPGSPWLPRSFRMPEVPQELAEILGSLRATKLSPNILPGLFKAAPELSQG